VVRSVLPDGLDASACVLRAGCESQPIGGDLTRVFLTAQWRYLAMLNYQVAPELLLPLVPSGTELDLWNGAAYISVVGFLFVDTRVLCAPIPFHRTFEEVNLRFYVRRHVDGALRRGVTFIRELVPRSAIALVARLAYNEPYQAVPMHHKIDRATVAGATTVRVAYEWVGATGRAGIDLTADGDARPLSAASLEEFITEHYWGYTSQRDGATVEYEVRHPRWMVWNARNSRLHGRMADVYPTQFAAELDRPPDCAFLADGSAVAVHAPMRISSR
jgi:uncharacterized protein YqjF (DUF2071 family)